MGTPPPLILLLAASSVVADYRAAAEPPPQQTGQRGGGGADKRTASDEASGAYSGSRRSLLRVGSQRYQALSAGQGVPGDDAVQLPAGVRGEQSAHIIALNKATLLSMERKY